MDMSMALVVQLGQHVIKSCLNVQAREAQDDVGETD